MPSMVPEAETFHRPRTMCLHVIAAGSKLPKCMLELAT